MSKGSLELAARGVSALGGASRRGGDGYRDAGEEVYVSTGYPDGLTVAEYHAMKRGVRYQYHWSLMRRDARVFVRGAVQHPDHDSLFLWCWHEVVPNRESEASAMKHVAFLD